ncbi:DUF3450 domain-containing protein [Desulfospira joergensenii]|uniref:DUF3450 domain-containing protein n=1 Tax=Desulfospira joergensenii TaxID=53329 RepID=UPI0003B39D1B|nr:DUF3450 domain-containing protein [Desulfospira joergensenii]
MKCKNSILKKSVWILPVLWAGFLVFPWTGTGRANTAQNIKKPVEESVSIRQKTQKKRDKWEQERTELTLLFEQLQEENGALEKENQRLMDLKQSQASLNQTLKEQKKEALKIQRELMPFLEEVYEKLEILISGDAPFLKEERTGRLARLKKVMDDPENTMASKYRKVMEALFIEAEYGTTIEVYQDKISLAGEEILGNIFRLGRVSLFFLSLDQNSAAYFNVAHGLWQKLPENHLMAVRSAVEIGKKRRSVELLALPLGRLAPGEGSGNE